MSLGAVIVVLVGAGVALLIHQQQSSDNESDKGSLTSNQYATAVDVARSEIAKDHARVTRALATVVPRRIQIPNLSNGCTSGQLLVVTLVGDFPGLNVSAPQDTPGAPTGPDTWVTVKADPTTGEVCSSAVGLGRFKAQAGFVDLTPAL